MSSWESKSVDKGIFCNHFKSIDQQKPKTKFKKQDKNHREYNTIIYVTQMKVKQKLLRRKALVHAITGCLFKIIFLETAL